MIEAVLALRELFSVRSLQTVFTSFFHLKLTRMNLSAN